MDSKGRQAKSEVVATSTVNIFLKLTNFRFKFLTDCLLNNLSTTLDECFLKSIELCFSFFN